MSSPLQPTLTTPGVATTLVTLNEAKSFVRKNDFTDDDATLTILIKAAYEHVSVLLGRSILSAVWTQSFGAFCDPLRLSVGVATAIGSVKYYDADNAEQTLAGSVYQLLTDSLGSYVSLKPDQEWPTIYDREDAITIVWTAGYGSTVESVPTPIKMAILHHLASSDEDREGESGLPKTAESLISPFRRMSV